MIGTTPNKSAPVTARLDPRSTWWRYLLVALASGLYLFLFVRVQWRIGDEGDIINGALAVTEGRVPYRDFLDVRGPASFYWLGLFFKVFGASWAVARAHLLLTGILTSVLVYHLTRRLYGGILSMLPSVLVTVLSIPNWPAPNHHWDSNLFALAAVAVFLTGQRERRLRWLFVSGVMAGLTSCFMYQKGFLLAVSLVVGLAVVHVWYSAKLPLLRGAIAILVGYCAVGVCALAWFHHIGGLSSLVESTIRLPLDTYIEANKTPYGYHLTLLTPDSWQLLRTTSSSIIQLLALFLMAPVLLIAALPFLIGLLVLLRLFVHSRTPATADEVILLTIGLALWFSEFHRRDIVHLIYGAPVLIIAAGLLWSRVSGMALQKLVAIPLLTTIVVMGAGQGIWASLAANEHVHTRRGNILLPSDDPALRFLLSDKVAAGDYVFVYPYYATYYFLADVRNPTRFGEMMYGPGLKPYFDEAIAAIEARRVKYILWDTVWEGENLKIGAPGYQLPPEGERWMDVYIREHYRQVDVLNGFRVMQRIEPSL